jgi:hypothetical protein
VKVFQAKGKYFCTKKFPISQEMIIPLSTQPRLYVRKRTAVVPPANIPGALFCRKKQKTAMTVTAFFKPWLIPRVTAVTAFNLAS